MLGDFDYEVALEILGQSQQPLVQARYDESNKENPNPELLKFIRNRMAAVDELINNLKPDDEYLIKRILDKNDVLRKLL
jgi:hypothetical protein